MTKATLHINGWHSDGDSEVLVYFQIFNETKEVWSSVWYDVRDLCEDKETLADLRAAVEAACMTHGIVADLSILSLNAIPSPNGK